MTFESQERWDYYLEEFRAGQRDVAFFGLIESDNDVLPFLTDTFRAERDDEVRAFLVKVIWQRRNPATTKVLAEALADPAPAVWKEALDGLVTLGTAEAIAVLREARSRSFLNEAEVLNSEIGSTKRYSK